MHHQHGVAAWFNTVSNCIIVLGYLLVPFTVLRYLRLNANVMASGTLFFVTCAITHLAMAFQVEDNLGLVYNHTVQAFAVVWFVLTFTGQLRDADRMLKQADALYGEQRGPGGSP